MANRKPPVATVRPHQGVPTFFVDDEPLPATSYRWQNRETPKEYIQRFVRAGIRLFYVDMEDELGLPFDEHLANVTQRIQTLRDLCPDAYIIPSIIYHLTPGWADEYPDECALFEDGTRDHFQLTNMPEPRYSLASDIWLNDVARITRENIRAIEASDVGDRVVGYHIRGGHYGEWGFWWDYNNQDHAIEFSPAMHKAFRRWLTERYVTDEAFADAWKSPGASITDAKVPSMSDRDEHHRGDWRDPGIRRNVFDYFSFYSDIIADRVAQMGKVVKEETGGDRLAGVFYGSLTCGSGPLAHRALSKVLASPEIDFVVAPPPYENRGPGDYSPLETVVTSVLGAGKVFVSEADNRTWLTNQPYGGGKAPSQSVAAIHRDFANILTHNSTNWWYDFARGWYDDDRVEEAFALDVRIGEVAWAFPRERVSDIAVIVDEAGSFCHSLRRVRKRSSSKAEGRLTEDGVDRNLSHRQIIHEMGRIGAPYDIWLFDDLLSGRATGYKLYVFLTCFSMTARQRATVHKRLEADDATALFAYGQGYCDPESRSALSVDHSGDLVGMRFTESEEPEVLAGTLTGAASDDPWRMGDAGRGFGRFWRPLTTGFELGEGNAPVKKEMRHTAPAIAVDDPEATVLGEFDFGGAALAVKERNGWTSVVCSTLSLPCWLIHSVARAAGAHLWTESGQIVFANQHFFAVHTAEPGDVDVVLPRKSHVIDCATCHVIAEDIQRVKLRFQADDEEWAETRICFYGSEEEAERARVLLTASR